jgi:hypothetical protein
MQLRRLTVGPLDPPASQITSGLPSTLWIARRLQSHFLHSTPPLASVTMHSHRNGVFGAGFPFGPHAHRCISTSGRLFGPVMMLVRVVRNTGRGVRGVATNMTGSPTGKELQWYSLRKKVVVPSSNVPETPGVTTTLAKLHFFSTRL